MEVFINHSPVETDEARTLAELLKQDGSAADGIGAADANKAVTHHAWKNTRMTAGTKNPVIRAV